MLNENKIKMMTKMAIFEKNNGKELKCHIKYYKSDYITYNLIKSLIAATIAYMIILVIVAVYNMDYLVSNINSIDYKNAGIVLIWTYLLFVIVYSVIAYFVHAYKYEKSKDGVKKYYSRLTRLERFYGNQKKQG